ncbi:hypothetical protein EJB05_46016, partial [Eragrostis curvula]
MDRVRHRSFWFKLTGEIRSIGQHINGGKESTNQVSDNCTQFRDVEILNSRSSPSMKRINMANLKNAMDVGHDELESRLQDPSSEPCKISLEYLRKITNHFSPERLLGAGGFGTVYKIRYLLIKEFKQGVLQNGKLVAVKKLEQRIDLVLQEKQFENEVFNLMRLKHPNFIQILGYCYEIQNKHVYINGKNNFAEEQKRLLCLEYMSKGSLDKYLSVYVFRPTIIFSSDDANP